MNQDDRDLNGASQPSNSSSQNGNHPPSQDQEIYEVKRDSRLVKAIAQDDIRATRGRLQKIFLGLIVGGLAVGVVLAIVVVSIMNYLGLLDRERLPWQEQEPATPSEEVRLKSLDKFSS